MLLLSYQNSHALDFQGSRTLGLGKAGIAGAQLNDSITLNPSLIGLFDRNSFSGTFNWLNNTETSPGASRRSFNVSAIDAINPYVGTGLSYTRRPDLQFVHLGLGKQIFAGFATGLSAKRFWAASNGEAAQGNSFEGYDTGVSVSYALPSKTLGVPLQLGLSTDNLLNRPKNESHIGPRQVGAGVKAGFNNALSLYADAVQYFPHTSEKYRNYSLAAELALGGGLFVRGGYFTPVEQGWGMGGGWSGPKMSINYGYQRSTRSASIGYHHAVTMDLFM